MWKESHKKKIKNFCSTFSSLKNYRQNSFLSSLKLKLILNLKLKFLTYQIQIKILSLIIHSKKGLILLFNKSHFTILKLTLIQLFITLNNKGMALHYWEQCLLAASQWRAFLHLRVSQLRVEFKFEWKINKKKDQFEGFLSSWCGLSMNWELFEDFVWKGQGMIDFRGLHWFLVFYKENIAKK